MLPSLHATITSMSFDLSSSTSSDEGSVVDISALLPDKKETKGWASSHLLDESSSSVGDERTTKNQGGASKLTSKKSTETIGKEAKDDGRTIRIVMGESVKTWQRQRNPHRSDDSSVPNTKYVVVQQSESSKNTKINQNYSSQNIDFEKSRLDVQKSMGGKNARVDIIETNEDKEKRYSTKLCKLPTSSAFVDCVAIWDPQRQVYTLEIPELTAASDSRLVSTLDEDDQNRRKRRGEVESDTPDRKRQRS